MSKLSIHKSGNATGYGGFLTTLVDAGVPLPCVFSLGFDTSADLARYSPTTISIFRDQRHGATPPDMYVSDPIDCANSWYELYAPIWRLNPSTFKAYINEEPLVDVESAIWYNAFTLQMQRRAHADGYKLCLFEFGSGNPRLELIPHILPCLREGKLHGDVWGQHAYWDAGDDQSFADSALYYQRIVERLPADCVLDFYLTEVSPGNGHNTVSDAEWFAEMDRIDHALMSDPRIKALCAYDLGGADSDFSDDLDEYAALIISNGGGTPPPTDDLTARVIRLEHEVSELQHALADLTGRVTTLEGGNPPPPEPVTAHITVSPTSIEAGQTAVLTWQTTGATSAVIPPFGPQALSGSKAVLPFETTTYVLTASGPGGTAQSGVMLTVTPVAPPPVAKFTYRGVGVGDNQPLTGSVLAAFDTAKSVLNAVKLFTLPDADLMTQAIASIRAKRLDTFIMARLFFSVNAGVPFTPLEFVAFCRTGLDAAYKLGVRYFEIHNEPNLIAEGADFNWRNGASFGGWLLSALSILRTMYPEAKWGYPGLSPNGDIPGVCLDYRTFFNDSLAAAQACDWVGAHQYWSNALPDQTGWRWTRDRVNKPIVLTEFSNNDRAVAYLDKGRQYRRFFESLESERNVWGAFSFALSWPGDDANREGWVYGNRVTPIPAGLVLPAVEPLSEL